MERPPYRRIVPQGQNACKSRGARGAIERAIADDYPDVRQRRGRAHMTERPRPAHITVHWQILISLEGLVVLDYLVGIEPGHPAGRGCGPRRHRPVTR